MRRLLVREEAFALQTPFVIARGSKTEARVVLVELVEQGRRGRGESVPYARYGESVPGVIAAIEAIRTELEAGVGRRALQELLPPGAARNACDCALFDLEAKIRGRPAHELAGLGAPGPVTTAYTLSLGSPEAMAQAARAASGRPLLKLKIGGAGDLDRIAAVRGAAPGARLIVDANEGLSAPELFALAPRLRELGVVLIEQPLPAGEDEVLEDYVSPVLLCADESLHTRGELAEVARRYGAVNIKLDKTGGLTEALALRREALDLGLHVMVGCMVASSLAMAPALLLAEGASFVDLDGPLLLARDRQPGLTVSGSVLQPAAPELWG